MKQHSLFSQEQDMSIAFFDKFDKEEIQEAIIRHLEAFPTDTVEHCKSFPSNDLRQFQGSEIINFYEVNPKTNKVCKVITKGNKEYFKELN